jgi:hypothetical protein
MIVLLSLNGASTITPASLKVWLTKKCEEYYRTPGTVTYAMRTFMESINQELLERNLKRAKTGAQITGMLNLAVVKRNLLYLAHLGATRSFFISAEESVEIKDDEQNRGLGISESLTFRFTQKELRENDTMIFAPVSPPVWTTEAFSGSNALSIEAFSRRLFNQTGGEVKAVATRFVPGKGLIIQNKMQRGIVTGENQLTPESIAPGENRETPAQLAVLVETPTVLSTSDTPLVETPTQITKLSQPSTTIPNSEPQKSRPPLTSAKNQSIPASNIQQHKGFPSLETKAAIGRSVKSIDEVWNKFKSSLVGFFQKILPGLYEEPLKLNRSVLIMIAIAVPLVFLILAGSVYVNRGKNQEFEVAMAQAQQYAVMADGQVNDQPSRLASLQQSLFWLEKAATYGNSDAMGILKGQVQDSLDQIQGILRLELSPLFEGSLPDKAVITQIVATNADVYLLDSTSGKVFRFFQNGNGYSKDDAFDCGLNPENLLSPIGKLIDILPLPVGNSFRATLYGIDAAGMVEFCVPGESGTTGVLNPPDSGWGEIKAISLFQNYLYVLDTRGNAVYRYNGDGVQFNEKPTLFFDNQVPPLSEAIDIEVNGYELYILRANGQMVECTYSPLKEYKLTECMDPAPFGDMRTGETPQTISFPQANFIQMRMTPAPDSSLYLLDANGKTLFHLSLQRNLQKILHPSLRDGNDLTKLTPTAFAISPGRIAFVAFGGQVFYSPLP